MSGLAIDDIVNQLLVLALANKLHDLVTKCSPDRKLLGERQWIVGAPPGELSAAFAPVAALPLAEHVGGVIVVVGPLVEAQRQLPAHLWLPIERTFVTSDRRLMKRATGALSEAGPIQEDAGIVDDLGGPFAVFVLVDWAAHLGGSVSQLPLVGSELLDAGHRGLAVVIIEEVGAIGAAAVFVLGGHLRKHALAAPSVDAAVLARQKCDVELPAVAIVVGECDPLVQFSCVHAGDRSPFQNGYGL